MLRVVKYWLLFILAIEPFAGLMVYYFKSETVVSILKAMTVVGVFLMLTCLHRLRKKQQRIVIFSIGIFLLLPLGVTAVSLFTASLYFQSLPSQFFGSMLFVTCFFVGVEKIDTLKLLEDNERVLVLILVMSTISIVFFRLDPFSREYYPSFQSTYLLTLFAYFLAAKKRLYFLWVLVLLVLHQKLAIVVLSLIVFSIKYFIEANILKKTAIAMAVVIIAALSTVQWMEELPPRIQSGVTSIMALQQGNLSKAFNSSLGEKLNEVYSANSQLLSTIPSFFVGNGFGWKYSLMAIEGLPIESEESYIRYYLHNSIFYNLVAYGFFGVWILLGFFYRTFITLIRDRKSYEIYYPLVAAVFLLESLSTLGLYTNVWAPLALGNLYLHLSGRTNE